MVRIVFIISFIVIISTPLTMKLLNCDYALSRINENRNLSKLPDIRDYSLKEYPRAFDQYINDSMPLRQVFMPAYISVWENFLESPVSEYVTGKNRELFMNKATRTVDNALGLHPWSDADRIRFKVSYAGKHAFYFSKGIKYYLVLIPDKSTVYPDLLPWYSTLIGHEGWYSEQYKALKDAGIINFISLKEYFDQTSDKVRLYDKKYDNCHWNGNALHLAYQKIASVIAADYPFMSPVNYPEYYELYEKQVEQPAFGTEITRFIRLKNRGNFECATAIPEHLKATRYNHFCTNSKVDTNSLWFFSDSYFGATHGSGGITPFVHNVHSYWHSHYNYDHKTKLPNYSAYINERLNFNRPDIVIEAFVERTKGDFAPYSDPLIRILGDYWLKNETVIDHTISRDSLKELDSSLETDGNELILKSFSSDPKLVFKDYFTADADGRITLSLCLNSGVAGISQLFYSPDGKFTEHNSLRKPVKKGDNLLHFELQLKPYEKVKLRFDPINKKGTFIIREIPELKDLRMRLKDNGI